MPPTAAANPKRPPAVDGPVWTASPKSTPNAPTVIPVQALSPDPKTAPAPALLKDQEPAASVLSREAAVTFALEHNPQLAVFREQRGMAAAGVVLARIYPYNPTFQSVVLGVNGPASSGITNHVFNEHYAVVPVELFGQGKQRRAAATAAVTRTEWEIAAQEMTTAIGVLRAYDAVLYRQQKLRLLEETVRLNEVVVKQGRKLADAGRLGAADVIIAGTDLDAARALVGQGRTTLAVARAELRRQLGGTDDAFAVGGELELPLPDLDPKALVPSALSLRPEIQARIAAITEANARLRLQMADRFGNPSIGPRVEYNETRDTFIGVVLTGPIPVLNRKQGEIAQRRADVSRAQADLRSTEYLVAHSVDAALDRLAAARKWAGEYSSEVLPKLKTAKQKMERLLEQNEPGVDAIKVLGMERAILRATDAYLDARFEVSQARADLAAAVGEPALATGAAQPVPEKEPPGPPPIQLPKPKD
jgi:outer membrane protein TolC